MRFRIATQTAILLGCSFVASAQQVAVRDNLITFPAISDYEEYANNEADRSRLASLARESTELTTLGEKEGEPGEDLYPEFLTNVLNEDGIMEIGSFLVKLDLINERGLAINASAPDAYSVLKRDDLSAPGLMIFDAEEENALEILEKVESGELSVENFRDLSILERRCGGAARNTCKNPHFVWDSIGGFSEPGCISHLYAMDYKVVYEKFIFYFSLQSKMKSIWGCSSTNWTLVPSYNAQLRLKGTVRYRKRCDREVVTNRADATFGNVIDWRPYEGSRSLSHYDFSVVFGISHPKRTDFRNANPCTIKSGY